MKREILCSICEAGRRKRYPNGLPYAGEHLKLVNGKALWGLICDYCGKIIQKEEDCCASSIWADSMKLQYYKWEHEYLQLLPK
ncbi:MAG: hypothetical protein KAU20_02315 [Nanoarchaeota archaeon]|nr:hypothetical protein [Nanoarchaeota archaeon]